MSELIERDEETAALMKLKDAADRYLAQVTAFTFERNAHKLEATEVPRLEFEQASRELADVLTRRTNSFKSNGTDAGTTFFPDNDQDMWQAPGQWLLDENNNIHRILAGRRSANDGPVELQRPVPQVPVMPVYFLLTWVVISRQDATSLRP